jgi:hypothetical protein
MAAGERGAEAGAAAMAGSEAAATGAEAAPGCATGSGRAVAAAAATARLPSRCGRGVRGPAPGAGAGAEQAAAAGAGAGSRRRRLGRGSGHRRRCRSRGSLAPAAGPPRPGPALPAGAGAAVPGRGAAPAAADAAACSLFSSSRLRESSATRVADSRAAASREIFDSSAPGLTRTLGELELVATGCGGFLAVVDRGLDLAAGLARRRGGGLGHACRPDAGGRRRSRRSGPVSLRARRPAWMPAISSAGGTLARRRPSAGSCSRRRTASGLARYSATSICSSDNPGLRTCCGQPAEGVARLHAQRAGAPQQGRPGARHGGRTSPLRGGAGGRGGRQPARARPAWALAPARRASRLPTRTAAVVAGAGEQPPPQVVGGADSRAGAARPRRPRPCGGGSDQQRVLAHQAAGGQGQLHDHVQERLLHGAAAGQADEGPAVGPALHGKPRWRAGSGGSRRRRPGRPPREAMRRFRRRGLLGRQARDLDLGAQRLAERGLHRHAPKAQRPGVARDAPAWRPAPAPRATGCHLCSAKFQAHSPCHASGIDSRSPEDIGFPGAPEGKEARRSVLQQDAQHAAQRLGRAPAAAGRRW